MDEGWRGRRVGEDQAGAVVRENVVANVCFWHEAAEVPDSEMRPLRASKQTISVGTVGMFLTLRVGDS